MGGVAPSNPHFPLIRQERVGARGIMYVLCWISRLSVGLVFWALSVHTPGSHGACGGVLVF